MLAAFQTTIGIASVLVNTIVLVVICKHKSLQNSQSSYKTSFAIADILYALLIIPFTIGNLISYKEIFLAEDFYDSGNRKFLFTKLRYSFWYNNIYKNIKEYFLEPAIFTVLMVSLYTLFFASADRLFAVYRPIKYRTMNMKNISKVVCVLVWYFCIFLACLPTISSYGIWVYFRVLLVQRSTNKYYLGITFSLILFVPFMLMSISSITTYYYVKKHARKAKLLSSRRKENNRKNAEAKLAKTLTQMVAAFCFMTLPSMIALILVIVLPSVNLHEPRELNINAYNAIDWLGIVGYLCLTCSTILNFLIYIKNQKVFRKYILKLMMEILDKLNCFCFKNKIPRLRTSTKIALANEKIEIKNLKTQEFKIVPSNSTKASILHLDYAEINNKETTVEETSF